MSNEKLVEALKLAQRWLANSQPIVDLDGPKPLPLIAEAIAEYERPRKTTATGMPERIYLRDDRYTSGNFIVSLTNRSSANPDFVYDHMVEYVRADTAYRHSAHSKSEYKRLKALGVDVVEPDADASLFQRLKLWLKERKSNYIDHDSWNGDTENGFYSTDEFNYEKLCKEIDAFGEQLRSTQGDTNDPQTR